jgi:hypothetical protein
MLGNLTVITQGLTWLTPLKLSAPHNSPALTDVMISMV